MGLFRGTEIVLDAEMNLNLAAGEPYSSSLRQFRRLRKLDHPQHIPIEAPSYIFAIARHRKLHMIKSNKRSVVHARNSKRRETAATGTWCSSGASFGMC